MPSTSIDIQGNISRTRVSGFIPIEDGLLRAVTAYALEPGADPAATWCEIGIMADRQDPQSRIAILDAGYIGTSAPVGANVLLNMEPTFSVYCDVYSADGTLVRLSILKETK